MIHLALLFGGRSCEHEISLLSAKSIYDAFDKNRFRITLLGIDAKGSWALCSPEQLSQHAEQRKALDWSLGAELLFCLPGDRQTCIRKLSGGQALDPIDLVFPIVHGSYGEDGILQGLLRSLDLPFVGPDVLGSALGMNKLQAKRILQGQGLSVAPFRSLSQGNKQPNFTELSQEFGPVLFVKPVSQGSSVGVSKVTSSDELKKAIETAFQYDNHLLIEMGIQGRELECSVLGNEEPKASMIGEVLPKDFYSYEAKYIDEIGASLEMPAKLKSRQVERIQRTAIDCYKALSCEGMARVDMFLTSSDELVINEINTLPGFTKVSMYPKLWELAGLPYEQLLNTLVDLALARYKRDSALLLKPRGS